jgi:hypothetical protein
MMLAYGFRSGDEVVSLVDHDEWLSKGDKGKVLGPSAGKVLSPSLLVAFAGHEVNVLAARHIKKRELAFGFVAGDEVVSLVDHDEWLSKGDKGQVVGRCVSLIDDKAARVLVAFADGRRANMLAASHIEKVALSGGFVAGDEVESLIDHTWLSKGDRGKVVGPSTSTSVREDKAARVQVAFADGHITNVLAAAHIQKVALASDFVAGDDVVSLIKHSAWLSVGDKGKVVGPSETSTPSYVRVAFACGQTAEVHARLHIKKEVTEDEMQHLFASMMLTETDPDPTLISHTHGRERRAERNIEKDELKQAIKFGVKEKANAARDGKARWRYTHAGVVFITDETSRHEITSWRLDGTTEAVLPADIGQGVCRTHTVIIVDNSGSMRQSDVDGHATRTSAVYDCLIRDFVLPQIKAIASSEKGKLEAVATLISMSDDAEVVFERQPFDSSMVSTMQNLKNSRAHHHGNYLPALEKALDVLEPDSYSGAQLFLVFLSDGAPSDHCQLPCQHGTKVWQDDTVRKRTKNGKFHLQVCVDNQTAQACRVDVKAAVREECVAKISQLGDRFGRDRTFIGTVAFGPQSEDYQVLQDMAHKLPRNSFQKLGLNAGSLKTAFSSLTSDLTTMNTQLGGKILTTRAVSKQEVGVGAKYKDIDFQIFKTTDKQWTLLKKLRWDIEMHSWVDVSLAAGAVGVAYATHYMAKGAERYVYQCTEINATNQGVGSRKIAKESLHEEYLNHDFHQRFCRMQAEAESLAIAFNTRLRGPAQWQVHYLQCVMYELKDQRLNKGLSYVLAENELDGKFTKWNNNGGVFCDVLPSPQKASAPLGAIQEEDEDDDEDEEGDGAIALLNQVPQCFSHFTYDCTAGKKLVCDLQGVWNKVDGFTLTDPVFHSTKHKHKNGMTDKHEEGIRKFFETHKCGELCRRLGLKNPKSQSPKVPNK